MEATIMAKKQNINEIKEVLVQIDMDIKAHWMYKPAKGNDGNIWFILKGPFDEHKIMRQKQAGFKLWRDLTDEEKARVNLYPNGVKKQACTRNEAYYKMKVDNMPQEKKTLEEILVEKEQKESASKENVINKLMAEVEALKSRVDGSNKKSKKDKDED
jgi:uncharacterized protein YjaZ